MGFEQTRFVRGMTTLVGRLAFLGVVVSYFRILRVKACVLLAQNSLVIVGLWMLTMRFSLLVLVAVFRWRCRVVGC